MSAPIAESQPEVFVESWAQSYGSPYAIDDDADDDADVAVVEGDFAIHDPATSGSPVGLAFVDGVRRGEASLYQFVDGRFVRGIAGAYACGTVRAPSGERAHFDETSTERFVIWGCGVSSELVASSGTWRWRALSTASDDPAAPLAELQSRMRVAEGKLAERLATPGTLVVADGPLNFSLRNDGIVGYIKRHEKMYLPLDLHQRVAELGRSQRTSLFRIGAQRFSCYLRLVDRGRGGPWEGIVRLEFSAEAGLEATVATAGTLAAEIPRYAGLVHRDPRAPQNLQPIGALERHLRCLLGPEAIAERAVRDAVAHRKENL